MPRRSTKKRKGISTASRKAKGRKLQQWVAEQVRSLFPSLTKEDVFSRGMGQGGSDVHLSTAAIKRFPYAAECKAQQGYKKVYDDMEQASNHSDLEPIVFLKMNRKDPLAVIKAEHFFELVDGIQKST